ncbi:10877_t:CDS:2 [Racocetra fulgida]|uniref:phenylalanine--tRNA ligase n=1 Tax=Racocetra fulgida TaxID=60492 RepID=A0A9N8YXN2_9GLOM|nr:10877_t:CDS:2 [Racocetra fulgida]
MLRVRIPYPVPDNSMPLIPWEYLEKHLILSSPQPAAIAEKLTACGLETNLITQEKDIYLEFTTLANRILLNCQIKLPSLTNKKNLEKKGIRANIATDNCSEFHCGLIKNVVIRESSPVLKKILATNNIRSINNVVDLANLVMLETGQPFHLIDYDTLPQKNSIEVRQAQKKERMITISGQRLTLSADDIVISSGQKIISLAGVIGAKKNSLTPHAQNILIECGTFSSPSIKSTSSRLALTTKSSQYFEKEVNLTGQAFSSFYYLTSLIQELSGPIYYLNAPFYRSDLTRAEDLIEEILRIYDYNKIPSSLPTWQKVNVKIISYSLISEKEKEDFLPPAKDFYQLLFPKSENHRYYRQSLIPSHNQIINYNLAHGSQDLRLFEIASIYGKTQSEMLSEELLTLSATGKIFNQPFPRVISHLPVSNFPASEKDLSLIFAQDINYNEVIKEIKRAGGEDLCQVSIFDVYQNPALVKEGKKSVSFRLVFQSSTKTLEKLEIEKTVTQITACLIELFRATKRS